MDEHDVSAWIGRKEQREDELAVSLAARIAATLGEPAPAAGQALPLLWHWAYFADLVAEPALGGDGHPRLGGFMPPAQGRNRMWAGGRLEFTAPLRVGEPATRTTTIADVRLKAGRSGSLLFVTLEHVYAQAGRPCLTEIQDVVYREPSPPRPGTGEAPPQAQWRREVVPTSTLLFRYSAVTFNGHRIHYDWPYATGTEGYPGLVVHGPLIATLSLHAFAQANPHARIRAFEYRGQRPLFAPRPFHVGGRIAAPGEAEVWAADGDGRAHGGRVLFADTGERA